MVPSDTVSNRSSRTSVTDGVPVCPDCDGAGEIVHGDTRTPFYTTEECRLCEGEGYIYPELAELLKEFKPEDYARVFPNN